MSFSNFHEICRICMNSRRKMVDVFVNEIYTQIMELTHLTISDDDELPRSICTYCNSQLKRAHTFVTKVKSADQQLRTALSGNIGSSSGVPQLTVTPEFENELSVQSTKNNEKDENMYMVVVPQENNGEYVEISQLSLEANDNIKCLLRSLVNRSFVDHNYPKSVNVSCGEVNIQLEVESSDQLQGKENEHLLNSYLDFIENLKSCKFIVNISHASGHSEVRNDITVYKVHLRWFKCSECSIIMDTMDDLNCHMERQHGNVVQDAKYVTEHECPVCSSTFTDPLGFSDHLAAHRSQDVGLYLLKVDECGQPVPAVLDDSIFTSLSDILKLSTVSELECQSHLVPDFLHGAFARENGVFTVREPLACDYCSHESDCFGSLEAHYQAVHSLSAVAEADVTLHCPVCRDVVYVEDMDESRGHLLLHLATHRSDTCRFVRVRRNGLLLEPRADNPDLFISVSLLCDLYITAGVTRALHDGEASFTCDSCCHVFDSRQAIKAHLKTHATVPPKTFMCEICGKLVRKGMWKKHASRHGKAHKAIAKSKCPICSKDFTSRNTMSEHLRKHSMVPPGLRMTGGSWSVICEVCGKSFKNNAALSKHNRSHRTEKIRESLSCDICSRSFSHQTDFDKHLAAHLNPRYVQCPVCSWPLPTAASLERHLKTHTADGNETFDCPVCRLSFLTKDGLTNHQAHKGHHVDKRPFQCNVCPEQFNLGKDFAQHIKSHPKYKMSECNLCGKKLATVQSLMLHKGRHFKSNGILCPYCGKQLFEERNYHRHLLTHQGVKPYECAFAGCTKAFYTVFEMRRHTKYHNNTRDFVCVFCSKRFYEANHLKVHVRTHTGERPYTCPHCNKGFVTRTRCKQHIKLTHQGVGYDLIQSKISKNVLFLSPG